MKKLLIVLSLALSSQFAIADAAKETVRVCVDVKDRNGTPVKDDKGKVKQNCKNMKKHEKLEGTRVPEKK
jgi:hypothetical protein